jgi:hypothetical protein
VTVQGETVYVLTAGTVTDDYSGKATPSWDVEPAARPVTTLAPPEPRPSQEVVADARNAVVNGWTLYLPAGDPVTAQDRVRVRGTDYPVQGTPASWPMGVVVQAYRTEG